MTIAPPIIANAITPTKIVVILPKMKLKIQMVRTHFLKKKTPPVVPKVEKVFINGNSFILILRPKFSRLSRGPVGFPGGGFGTLPTAGAGAPALIF